MPENIIENIIENRYLEYNLDGYVVKITNTVPIIIEVGNKVAIASNENFEEGSEFDNYIVVQEVDEDGNLTSSCMVRQPDSVKFLRQERDILKEDNVQLKIRLAKAEQVSANNSIASQDLLEMLIDLEVI